MFPRFHNIHFVGIGGIGMSGIAELLINLGYRVTGSDLKRSSTTTRLRKKGAKVYYQHQADNIDHAHVVVISSAIHPENPELLEAQRRNIPVIPRAEMLSELMRLKYGIAVAGSHGKTTTTSMIGHLLLQAKFDPTMVIGGKLNSLRSNAKLGKGKFLVAEADESDGSFMLLNPSIALITNIDPEHMDHYKDFETLKQSFIQFANKVPFYGYIIACHDHPTVRQITPRFRRKCLTYGLSEGADYRAINLKQKGLEQSFEFLFREKSLGRMHLHMPGRHNVCNALGALAVARELDVPLPILRKALREFKGIQRRLQILYQGEAQTGPVIFDDYAHHPVEIQATLSALREAFPQGKLKVIFQPHRYSRTRDHFDEFAACFEMADQVLLTEIYAASEEPIVGVSSLALAKKMQHPQVDFFSDKSELTQYVLEHMHSSDVIVSMGAGDISQWGHQLARAYKLHLKKIKNKSKKNA